MATVGLRLPDERHTWLSFMNYRTHSVFGDITVRLVLRVLIRPKNRRQGTQLRVRSFPFAPHFLV